MKLNKYILMTSALIMGANCAFADDFESFDDFASFGDDTSSGAATALEVNGTVESDIRAYVDTSDKDDKEGADKIDISAIPSAKLDLKYSGNKSDVELKLKVNEDTIKNHPEARATNSTFSTTSMQTTIQTSSFQIILTVV